MVENPDNCEHIDERNVKLNVNNTMNTMNVGMVIHQSFGTKDHVIDANLYLIIHKLKCRRYTNYSSKWREAVERGVSLEK